jgi:adenosylmethionine-8-amino-7-oxononanoate aminotransferase
MTNKDMIKRDLEVLWHPCTQMKDHENISLVPIKSAKGIYLYDFDGNRYIDAVSSWWVNIFGHANEHIGRRIKEQLDTLEHVILAGFTHEPVVELSHKLKVLTKLDKAFYADNGSSAIEVALKMSFHYHLNKGEHRELFLSLENSYHGETLGALSVGDVALYKETYGPLLIRSIQTPTPKDQSMKEAQKALEALEKILKKHHKELCAMIVEPLVQGAGGMKMYHSHYLKGARELTLKYGVHFIADEIMTGFGRTGSMFACEQADILPDFMTLSKGLTAGYLPLSVVMTTNDVYNAFYCDYSEYKAFLHSHSYTGNPLGCAAALATLELFEKNDVINANKQKSLFMAQQLERFRDLENVKEVRITGMIAVIELEGYDPKERVGLKIFQAALKKEVLLRPLGNIIYVMPPYVITQEELQKVFDVAYEAIVGL